MRSLNVRPEDKIFFFTGIDGARFRRPVVPGDQIRFEVEVLQQRRQMCRLKGTALVDGVVAAEAEMSAMLVDRDLQPSSRTPLGA